MKLSLKSLGLCSALLFAAGHAAAVPSDFSFTGNLAHDDAVQLFSFTVAAPSVVTLRSWSYAGGTNAAGSAIAAGGFDPIISLFDASGNYVDANDDGGANVAPHPVWGTTWDSFLALTLGAGTYTMALTQFSNWAIGPNLAQGFDGSGVTGFNGDTSFWAVDLLNVESAAMASVPEPASLILAGLALAGLGLSRRGRPSATAALA